MKNKTTLDLGFEMIADDDNNSIVVKKVYPDNLTSEEISNAEKHAPEVILHCFNVERIHELQDAADQIAQHYHSYVPITFKRRNVFQSLKSLFV